MIKIKDSSVLYSLLRVPFDETLISVLVWLDDQYPGRVVITSGYRSGNSIHGTIPCRAVDLRSWIFKDPELRANYINHMWEYDHKRPDKKVCVYHDSGRGLHFHIQVHPNTKYKGGKNESYKI